MSKLLVVDDDLSVQKVLATLLRSKGYDVSTASDGTEALSVLAKEEFNLMLSDVRMSPMDGLTLLKLAKEKHPNLPTIMLTAFASVETAINALKFGAFDYITKPFNLNDLLATVARAIEYDKGLKENKGIISPTDASSFYLENIVAESKAMKDICETIKRIAPAETIVTIIGETGTGKGLIAHAIHATSLRKEKQFSSTNCAIMPEPLLQAELLGYDEHVFPGKTGHKQGLFELTRGGTLFLEEVNCLPLSIQEDLLKIIQDRKVIRIGSKTGIPISTRLIVSSNTDLENAVKTGLFREDLYYRFNVITIKIKPLRERPEDIMPIFSLLIQRYLGNNIQQITIDSDASAAIQSYSWPGNTDEMENIVIHIKNAIVDNNITKNILPPQIANVAAKSSVLQDDPNKGKFLKAYLRTKGSELLKKAMIDKK